MSRRGLSLSTKNMVATSKGPNKVVSCSTPEHELDSPSRDSDSLCDSEAASPVPFLCTQDGTEGETDVIWNYYTPKAEQTATSRLKNSTPLSRKAKKTIKKSVIERPLPRRRALRSTKKKTELFQDLIELNQNLQKFKKYTPTTTTTSDGSSDKPASGSEEDLFNNSSDCSPKSGLKTNSRCLRKNLLSSKFSKPEFDTALESDDSMNECLIKASQIVEENILQPALQPPRLSSVNNFQDSMDSILNNIKLDSPIVYGLKKHDSPNLKNDSFDSFVGNLNDSALERLTQLPVKDVTPIRQNKFKNSSNSSWMLQELKVFESPTKNTSFSRHSSMPESPSVTNICNPSTSGSVFGRHNSMPFPSEKKSGPGDSPIQCTPDEIRKKHLQAREKLHAKRLLPFTCSQTSTQSIPLILSETAPKKSCFQPKVTTARVAPKMDCHQKQNTDNSDMTDLKKIIEKKRQEALMKLRRKQNR